VWGTIEAMRHSRREMVEQNEQVYIHRSVAFVYRKSQTIRKTTITYIRYRDHGRKQYLTAPSSRCRLFSVFKTPHMPNLFAPLTPFPSRNHREYLFEAISTLYCAVGCGGVLCNELPTPASMLSTTSVSAVASEVASDAISLPSLSLCRC
jgi:hypothetical protein